MKNIKNEMNYKTKELVEKGKKKTKDSWFGAKEKAKSTIESAKDLIKTGKKKIVLK